MARAKREGSWRNLGIQIDEKLYNLLKEEARTESRTLTATVEMILKEHFNRSVNSSRKSE